MAKRHRKGRKHRKNVKRSRAAKRAYKKSGLYRYNLKRKGKKHRGKRKHRGGKRGGKRKHRRAGGGHHSTAYYAMYQTLINRGRSPALAHKIAARAERMRSGHAKRHFGAEQRQREAAAAWSNFAAGLAGAGRAARAGL